MIGAKTTGPTGGYILKLHKKLTSDTTVVSDSFNTTSITSLDATGLEANKKYRITWHLGSVSSASAGLVWRLFPSYPSGYVSFISYAAPGAGATISSLTPSNNTLVNANNPQLAVNNIFICEFSAQILMGSTAGTVSFGIRNVTAGSASLLAEYSYVSVYEVRTT